MKHKYGGEKEDDKTETGIRVLGIFSHDGEISWLECRKHEIPNTTVKCSMSLPRIHCGGAGLSRREQRNTVGVKESSWCYYCQNTTYLKSPISNF